MKQFDKGELGEGKPWELREAGEPLYYEDRACKHCIPITPTHETLTYHDSHDWCDTVVECVSYLMPQHVVCYNEGGHNATYLCVECLLDAIPGAI